MVVRIPADRHEMHSSFARVARREACWEHADPIDGEPIGHYDFRTTASRHNAAR